MSASSQWGNFADLGKTRLEAWMGQLSSLGCASCGLSFYSRLACSYSHPEVRGKSQSVHDLLGLCSELAFYTFTSSTFYWQKRVKRAIKSSQRVEK